MFQLTLASWKCDELSTKLLRNKKLRHRRYLLFWEISSADPGMLILSQRSSDYRKTHDPWSYNLGQNHEKRNSKSNPPPPPSLPNHGWNSTIFPSLFVGAGGINFPSISYKHRRQPGGILNINYSRLRDEIPAPGSSVPRTLVKAKLRRQTSEGQRDLQ